MQNVGQNFRFYKNYIYRLKNALQIPDIVRTYNRLAVNGEEALCTFLNVLVTRVAIQI